MSEKKIEGHEYDGITELDNPLPGWWLATFYITIIFAVIYYSYYELGSAPTQREELAQAQQNTKDLIMKNGGGPKGPTLADLNGALKNKAELKEGAAVFQAKCTSCHGAQGQGVIGPNLTDRFWLHGGKITDIAKTVSEGVLEKGMPAWGGMLKADELIEVVAYVKTLQGTNPPNPKPPQGSEFNE